MTGGRGDNLGLVRCFWYLSRLLVWGPWLVGAITTAAPEPASAQATPAPDANLEAAREAYDRGTKAFARKDYAVAAAEFSRADELGPNPVALEEALKAAILADDPVLGMTLVDRADQRPAHEGVGKLTKRARDKFETRAGRLSVTCADERACSARLSGQPLVLGKRVWVLTGDQAIEVTVEGATTRHVVTIAPGASVDWQPPAPPRVQPATQTPGPATVTPTAPVGPTPPPSPAFEPASAEPGADSVDSGGGISPVFFFVGVGVTAAIGGGVIASGVDTLALNDDYMSGDDSARDPGQAAQLRTNILVGAMGGAAVATLFLGIFADWGGPSASTRPTVAIGPGFIGVTGRY